MFRKIKGQESTLELLQKAIEHDRISQAYLFHGSDGVGKFMTALYFGMAVNCAAINQLKPCGICSSCHKFLSLEHPDFLYVFPTPILNLNAEGEIKNSDVAKQYQAYLKNKISTPWQEFFFKEITEIRKESIGLLSKRLELSIHEARYRIVIIENADMMNIPTANAFLKTLEEPPSDTVIIMITERMQMMLPTIISRTQPVYFKPLTRGIVESILINQFEVSDALARTASRISAGNLKTAIRIGSDNASPLRDWAFEIITLAAKSDELGFLALMDKNKDRQKKDQLIELLKYVRIIISDLATLSTESETDITNIDMIDTLKDIAKNKTELSSKTYEYLLWLEDLNRKIDGNVNLNLVILNLFLKTKNLLSA